MRLVAPETITFTQSGFCPGCGHGLAVRLIAEVMEEMGLSEKLLAIVDVACGSLNIDSWRFDTIMAAHGRPIATAVGVKKIRPENPVMAYIGDGAAYSIGMAETMHTALRNDNVVTVVINNSLYGMTGGQCAPTSLPGQITTSTPRGKDPKKAGMPFRVEQAFTGFDIAYLARGTMADAKGMMQSKKYIKKAFEKHMKGEGFCLVELLSPCPTNLNMTPVKSVERLKNEMDQILPAGRVQGQERGGIDMGKEIICAGFGGQGVLTAGMLLINAGMEQDKNVLFYPSYGSEMRGGTANCTVKVSEKLIASPISKHPDILFTMNTPAIDKFEDRSETRRASAGKFLHCARGQEIQRGYQGSKDSRNGYCRRGKKSKGCQPGHAGSTGGPQ